MKTAPLITVFIPCYNSHLYLSQAIESVQRQTLDDIEILVVNDGSNDPETLEVLKRLPSDIKVVHQENKGLPASRNTGFREARGRYVLPLDADDWLEPDFLEKTLAALQSDKTIAFATSYMSMEDEKKGILKKKYNFFEQLFLNQIPYCILIKRTSWEYVGGYDESFTKGYEDWEFNIRLGLNNMHGIVVEEPLFHYRISKSGMLMGTSAALHAQLWDKIQKKHPQLFRASCLIRLWSIWGKKPMTYSPLLLAIWLTLHRLMPTNIFNRLMQAFRRFSHSKRVDERI